MERIVERILSDAKAEAEAILAEATAKAERARAESNARVEAWKNETVSEMDERRKSILEKKAAAARLESGKILLAEKRRVIDTIYDEAHSRLLELPKEDCLQLIARMLGAFTEDGDEILFSENFQYENDVLLLPIVAQRNLKVSKDRLPLDGGLRLRGEKSDKDISYGAILKADREEYQASIAKNLFK